MTALYEFHWFQMFQSFKTFETKTHHEGREGHEDRITERASNLQKIVFFLHAPFDVAQGMLRVLRRDIGFSFGYGEAVDA